MAASSRVSWRASHSGELPLRIRMRGAYAYTDGAIDQAHRAVNELLHRS